MKTRVSIILLIIAVLLLGTTSAQASPGQDFYLEKVCPSDTNPNACDIVAANPPFAGLVGGLVIYDDLVYWANPAGHEFEIARVEITTGADDGMVTGQIRWIKDHGLFTLRQGSGSLDNLYATGRVNWIGEEGGHYRFSLTGTYHIEP